MADTFLHEQATRQGSFVTNTSIFDVGQLQETNVNSEEFKELLVRLYQNVNNIAIVLNSKTTGMYLTNEFVTSELFFNTLPQPTFVDNQGYLRPIFRKVINIGALGSGVTTVAHGLPLVSPTTWSFIDIIGSASDQTGLNFYPLPFASAAGATNIELRLTGTNVVITNNSGVTFSQCDVIVRYIKQ